MRISQRRRLTTNIFVVSVCTFAWNMGSFRFVWFSFGFSVDDATNVCVATSNAYHIDRLKASGLKSGCIGSERCPEMFDNQIASWSAHWFANCDRRWWPPRSKRNQHSHWIASNERTRVRVHPETNHLLSNHNHHFHTLLRQTKHTFFFFLSFVVSESFFFLIFISFNL